MSEYFGINVEDIFNSMKDRFRPEGAAGVSNTFGYKIKDTGKWKLTIADGTMQLDTADDVSDCDVVLDTAWSCWRSQKGNSGGRFVK